VLDFKSALCNIANPNFVLCRSYPGANNQTLLAQFNRVHNPNPYFESPVVKEDAFIIKHYAGKVKYQIKVKFNQ